MHLAPARGMERGCVVLDQPQHPAGSRPLRTSHTLRLVFDTAALRQNRKSQIANIANRKSMKLRLIVAGMILPGWLAVGSACTASEAPPADIVPFAGLSPQEACDKATLPPGFRMHVFAAEPDLVQPIAFALDDRGRVWVAEGMTYPRRRGAPPKEALPADADRSKPTPAQLEDIFHGADRILV